MLGLSRDTFRYRGRKHDIDDISTWCRRGRVFAFSGSHHTNGVATFCHFFDIKW